jgi:PmbA protein
VLPDPQPAPPLTGLFDGGLENIDPQRKVQFALDLERATVGRDPRVKRVSDAVYSDGSLHVELANSRGLRANFDRSVAYGTVEAIGERDGEMQSGFAFTYGRSLAGLAPEAAASEAVDNAAGLLGARPHPTARVPVVLHPHAAAMILGVLGGSFSADAVLKRRSLLKDRIGQPVASSSVSIVDDARLTGGLASRPFDGEGTPSRRTPLVSDGILQRYLHNTYTGMRTGEQSTASAVRSYKSVPEVGVSNLFLEPGSISREALVARVQDGLHVSQLHGLHTVNPVSGDFSLGLHGHWIRHGSLAEPVREMTIAGNLIGLISRVAAIASDLRFIFAGGFCGSPTILVEELPVAGA